MKSLDCVPHLEQLARVSGGSRTRAAAAAARAAVELVDCDAAFVIGPGEGPGLVEAVAAATCGASAVSAGAVWPLGIAATRLFAHPWRSGGHEREPWEALRGAVGEADLRSWESMPLRDEAAGTEGALVVAGRHPERAGRRVDLVEAMAASTAIALSGCAVGERAALDEMEAEERRHTLSNLAFGVSHSLGNIFGAILGNLQMLEDEADDPRITELVRRVNELSEAGLDLMRALRDYAVLPGAHGMAAIDLNELVREVVELARALCAPWRALAGVGLEADLATDCPAWGDAAQVRQALVGIIFNAIEAVAGHGRICVSTAAEGAQSLVSVHDDGPGMSADVARRASEPFFTTRRVPRRGLGVAIARGIGVAHRGGLKIIRPRESGTIVTLTIAQGPPNSERPSPGASAQGLHGAK